MAFFMPMPGPDHIYVPIAKLDDDERLFGGWAYVSKMPDGTLVEDISGDVVDSDEAWDALRKAFVRYALVGRSGDLMHEDFGAASLVEMFISDDAKWAALGLSTGVLPTGVYVSYRALESPAGEKLWRGVKSGEIRALSIVGQGYREDLADEDSDDEEDADGEA